MIICKCLKLKLVPYKKPWILFKNNRFVYQFANSIKGRVHYCIISKYFPNMIRIILSFNNIVSKIDSLTLYHWWNTDRYAWKQFHHFRNWFCLIFWIINLFIYRVQIDIKILNPFIYFYIRFTFFWLLTITFFYS